MDPEVNAKEKGNHGLHDHTDGMGKAGEFFILLPSVSDFGSDIGESKVRLRMDGNSHLLTMRGSDSKVKFQRAVKQVKG